MTAGLALARLTGAAYHVNADDPVAFGRVAVRDGDVIEVSPVMGVRVLATPGHTFTHLYVLQAAGSPRGFRRRVAAFLARLPQSEGTARSATPDPAAAHAVKH